jgi:hypothetical protein
MPDPMAQTFAVPDDWAGQLTVATLHEDPSDRAGLARLPAEWQVVDSVVLDDIVIEHVVVGPNGIFTVSIDPDPTPATVADDGLYRDDHRVTWTVKNALVAAHDLRRRMGEHVFAYPLLVSSIEGERTHLDRLGIVPGHRIAEAIWSHPGLPMRRSARVEALWALRSLTS